MSMTHTQMSWKIMKSIKLFEVKAKDKLLVLNECLFCAYSRAFMSIENKYLSHPLYSINRMLTVNSDL